MSLPDMWIEASLLIEEVETPEHIEILDLAEFQPQHSKFKKGMVNKLFFQSQYTEFKICYQFFGTPSECRGNAESPDIGLGLGLAYPGKGLVQRQVQSKGYLQGCRNLQPRTLRDFMEILGHSEGLPVFQGRNRSYLQRGYFGRSFANGASLAQVPCCVVHDNQAAPAITRN